ncbi:MAG TPA: hypothetical protein ENN76_02220, partial [Euryarchaeota archaeon]|nr:hypothetical protein [Euryarchaeota archaeon]
GQEIGRFLPTRNFRYGQFEHYESITSETMRKELSWKNTGCFGCGVIQCSKVSHWDGKEMEGPEYETTAYLGSNCELKTAKDVAEANYLCDKYGLDTISTGVTTSFALECAERGLLSEEDNERLRFGDASSVFELIHEIAQRRGPGNILAEGTRRAARAIGMESNYFAMNTGGMELSGVNPLGSYSMGLTLATSDFASHTRFWSASDEMNGNLNFGMLPSYIIEGQDGTNARNCLIVCDFLPYGFDRLVPFLNAATGFDCSESDMLLLGERLQSLARDYALKTGRTHDDDVMPPRFFEETSFAGLMEGKIPDRKFFEGQVQEIFKLRGWDAEGKPTQETMARLGLE